jgi:amino acid adenylation domain-containing protein/non-ribosomal peptide synthase protein (TIGR01720 family)
MSTRSEPAGSFESDPKRQALFAAMLRHGGLRVSGRERIPRRASDDATQQLPLSFAQQRLWFLDQLVPDNAFYNVSTAVRVAYPLNVRALAEAIEEILRRHEVLRTVFPSVDGRPVQSILPATPLNLPLIDLGHLPRDARQAEATRLADEEARRPFDLAAGPLTRFVLLSLGEADYLFVATMHHIVSDGWSIQTFARELAALYATRCAGLPSPLPELSVQYADFSIWQRQYLTGERLESELRYWREQLKELPLVDLPTDRPRPPIPSFRGDFQTFTVSSPVSAEVKSLARKENATPFMVLLAAFGALLSRYCAGQTDIAVGVPTAGRNRLELEDLIGFFINTLVMRLDLSGDPTFRQLVGRVKQTAVDAFAHQDLPFEMLVEALQARRDPSRNPLFQVTFQLFSGPGASTATGFGAAVSPTAREAEQALASQARQGTANFDLRFDMGAGRDGFFGRVEYATDLFDALTVQRMIGHFVMLLRTAASSPDTRVSALPILSEAERQQVVVGWNDTARPIPLVKCVHELFAEEARRDPDAVAVSDSARQLSYGELDGLSGRVARQLTRLGVRRGSHVAVCAERSVELVAGLLGVLRTGAAYVPMDPAYPRDRLAFMLGDSGATALLSHSALCDRLPSYDGPILLLDRLVDPVAPDASTDDRGELGGMAFDKVNENDLCFIIYTSGSTGKPKGTQLRHGGLLNLVAWYRRFNEITPADRATQVSGSAYDAVALELWPFLAAGASVHIIDEATRASPDAIIDWIRSERITLAFLPTPLADAVLKLPWPHDIPLRALSTGGDKLHFRPAQDLGFQLVNLYGPTENTVVGTAMRVDPAPVGQSDDTSNPHAGWSARTPPPIGRPIDNVQAYVLDSRHEPVPIDVPGELHLAGAGLAHGYLGRSELTAHHFIANPFVPGTRMYRTGDLARWRADGQLEFLGRADHQVKIRGYRVEPGEIEATLVQHPAIREAVVVAEQQGDDRRLIAYVVMCDEPDAQPGSKPHSVAGTSEPSIDSSSASPPHYARQIMPSIDELRSFLQQRLPAYMVPVVFIALETMPLTPNGKIDRQALPAPDSARPHLRAALVAPSTEVERVLARIWADVLRLDRVGVKDNFFELGGDSILSIQIIARANQAGIRITPQQLFLHQTIAELAAVVGEQALGSPDEQESDFAVSDGPIPLTPIQRWFFEQDPVDRHHFNQAVVLDLWPAPSVPLMESALNALLAHHEALRARFVGAGEQSDQAFEYVQTIGASGESVALSRHDLSTVPVAGRLARFEAEARQIQAGLDLARGPLFRTSLFTFGAGEPAKLLIVVHHLAVDGVSWRILLEDLATAYQQLAQGRQVQLPPKTSSYRRWARRLTEYASTPQLHAELPYWLNTRREPFDLPLDCAGASADDNTVASAHECIVTLTEAQTRALLRDAPTAYRTQIHELLLAAMLQAFAAWTGRNWLRVDVEGHGREPLFDDVDVSRTVGWFTSLYPLLLEAESLSDPGALIRSVKEQVRRIPRHGIGYGVLRYLANSSRAARALAALPASPVLFNYLGQFEAPAQALVGGQPSSSALPTSFGAGASHSTRRRRTHLLEVNGSIAGGRLHFAWTYSERLHHRATIESLARSFADALLALVVHCQAPGVRGDSPSDFARAKVSQADLDKLLSRLGRRASPDGAVG